LHLGATEQGNELIPEHRPLVNNFPEMGSRDFRAKTRVGVIGLGAGVLAWYAQPHQDWTYYEINPIVDRIARNRDFFTYLHECRARRLEVVLGDGRMRIQEALPYHYDLIVLDAFAGANIPVHLLTKQAFDLYLSRLARDGMVAVNIASAYLDLKPVLAGLARHAGLACRFRSDEHSAWVVLARREEDLGELVNDPRWQLLPEAMNNPVWTDDFTNIFGILK